jgi:hypothetical protein
MANDLTENINGELILALEMASRVIAAHHESGEFPCLNCKACYEKAEFVARIQRTIETYTPS